MDLDYAFIQVEKVDNKLKINQFVCMNAELQGKALVESGETIFLKVNVRQRAVCQFSYSLDGKVFKNLGEPF